MGFIAHVIFLFHSQYPGEKNTEIGILKSESDLLLFRMYLCFVFFNRHHKFQTSIRTCISIVYKGFFKKKKRPYIITEFLIKCISIIMYIFHSFLFPSQGTLLSRCFSTVLEAAHNVKNTFIIFTPEELLRSEGFGLIIFTPGAV